MNASALLVSLSDQGYHLKAEGEGVRCHPKPSNEVRELIKANKAEILSALRSENSAFSGDPSPDSSAELVPTAVSVAEMLPEGDPDRRNLTHLIDKACHLTATEDDQANLAFALIGVYGRRINTEYHAAIWGGRTWREVQKERGRP